jgi:integrase/recombinase XerC
MERLHTNIYTYKYTHIGGFSMNELTIIKGNEISTQQSITAGLFERFIAYIDAQPKTIETYTKALRQLFNYFSLNGITRPQREDIIAFREELKASGHKPTTVQSYITATRLFFQWTAEENLYPNIAERLKGAKLDKEHKKDYLTSRQVKEVLSGIEQDTLQGLRDYAILTLMVTGGLRTIEVIRANIEDLRTVADSTALFIQGKGREEKTEYIKITAPVEKAIRAYLKARGTAEAGEPLFTSLSNNSKGERLSTRSISGIVKGRLQAAGYDSSRLTAHSLRHTAVTLSLLAGRDLAEVQQFARHANIATTMIYNHALDKAKNTCSEAVAAAIF